MPDTVTLQCKKVWLGGPGRLGAGLQAMGAALSHQPSPAHATASTHACFIKLTIADSHRALLN